jgi:hypothetical protein
LTKPSRPIDEYLLDLVPENPTAVLWIDVAKFRASLLWQTIEELSKSEQGVLFFKEAGEAGFSDPLRQIDEVVLVYTTDMGKISSDGDEDQLLILLKGSFGARNVLDALVNDEKGSHAQNKARSFEIKEFPAVRHDEFTAIAITDRTLAIATPKNAFRVAERARGNGTSLKKNPSFSDFSIGGPEAVKLRYRKGQSSPRKAGSETNSGPMDLEGLHGLDGSVVLREGLDFLAKLHLESETQAAQIERELEAIRGDFSHNMLAVMIGIEWVFDRITIRLSEKTVSISARLDAQDMEALMQLVDRLQKIKQLLDTGEQGPSQGDAPYETPGGTPNGTPNNEKGR